jgi:hypothetical protein
MPVLLSAQGLFIESNKQMNRLGKRVIMTLATKDKVKEK